MSKCWCCNEELTTANYCDAHIGICTKCYNSMFQGNKVVKWWTDKIADLEAKLAEKEKAYQELLNSIKIKDLSNINFIQVNDDATRFSESGTIYEYNKKDNTIYKIIDKSHQDKISFCIEQLENVRNEIHGICFFTCDFKCDEIMLQQSDKIIDNQIEELTHQHEDKGE